MQTNQDGSQRKGRRAKEKPRVKCLIRLSVIDRMQDERSQQKPRRHSQTPGQSEFQPQKGAAPDSVIRPSVSSSSFSASVRSLKPP